MRSLFLIMLISVLSISCEVDSASERQENSFFKVPYANERLKNYMDSYKDGDSSEIYTLYFDTDTTVIFSKALYVKKDDLVGYSYINDDVILLYAKSVNQFIDLNKFRSDSITKFPYLNQVDQLWPFDPIEKKYDLKNKVEIKIFEGVDAPVLLKD
ncbi:MAG: hypothetical protein HWE22_13640 [Flavobacteriales bacterium]|nr:hypothetical protein [Flavobacteriales bacterium]